MHTVLLLGSGKIGRMIAWLLSRSGDYQVRVADSDPHMLDRVRKQSPVETLQIDAADSRQLSEAMNGCQSVISALSFRYNPMVAEVALRAGASYFDLTEDTATARRAAELAAEAREGQIFVPQCGLAPGFISIIARHLVDWFDEVDSVRMRVGALPQFPSNALKYNLTWSTDGLINEYCNTCDAIHDSRRIDALPLDGLEHFSLDGVRYEAFNTSGGLGTLCTTLEGRVRELNYRTIRYLGHRDLMSFLLGDLRLSERRDLLKDILERSIPVTFQDVVVTFCTVSGWRKGQLVQLSDARKIYHQTWEGEVWSAIQITTAAGICAVLDLHVAGRLPSRGLVRQEQVDFQEFIANRFGRHYEQAAATHFGSPPQPSAEGA
ncbi:MAG: saccharopine dehydrogenase NADP-binding domain-containing protein [Planctomycetes bacterium]|nr:saccharopine dehydrogenase NADP-binding domain-containing protein [Planctomycetota bacterium]